MSHSALSSDLGEGKVDQGGTRVVIDGGLERGAKAAGEATGSRRQARSADEAREQRLGGLGQFGRFTVFQADGSSGLG